MTVKCEGCSTGSTGAAFHLSPITDAGSYFLSCKTGAIIAPTCEVVKRSKLLGTMETFNKWQL